MLRSVCAFSFLLAGTSAPALGQTPTSQPRPITFSVAAGPSRAFRGVDARGVEWHGAIARAVGHGLGLRLEGAGHWYTEQPLYPCIVQDAVRCYQTMRRAVTTGILNGTYHISRLATDKDRTVPYLISGLGIYRSRRVATRYNDCQPVVVPCDRGTYKLEMRDTQFGWSGGIGLDFGMGSLSAFSELRLHYVYNDRPSTEASNDYFLWPLSIGFRF